MMLVKTKSVPIVVNGLVTVTQFPDDRLVLDCKEKLVVQAGHVRTNLFVRAYAVLRTGGGLVDATLNHQYGPWMLPEVVFATTCQ